MTDDSPFYTLRKAGHSDRPTYELAKWVEGEIAPLDVYVMWLPFGRFHSCNCPSRSTPCKHWPIAELLLTQGEEALPQWLVQEGVLHHTGDIP